MLEVEDDGPGIPAADRERVFQRFYRRGDSPGSGLGLAIVGEVCRAHRAQIQARPGRTGWLAGAGALPGGVERAYCSMLVAASRALERSSSSFMSTVGSRPSLANAGIWLQSRRV